MVDLALRGDRTGLGNEAVFCVDKGLSAGDCEEGISTLRAVTGVLGVVISPLTGRGWISAALLCVPLGTAVALFSFSGSFFIFRLLLARVSMVIRVSSTGSVLLCVLSEDVSTAVAVPGAGSVFLLFSFEGSVPLTAVGASSSGSILLLFLLAGTSLSSSM